jgi:hypothetical protein
MEKNNDFFKLLRNNLNNKPFKVSLDIDGTLALFHNLFVEEYNYEHNTNYTIQDICQYNCKGWNIPITTQKFLEMYDSIWIHNWENIKPSISSELLDKFTAIYSTDIITFRPPEHQLYLSNWLNKYFPNNNLNIKYTKSPEEKLYLGYNILFDDANPLAEELIKSKDNSNTILFLIKQPWNANENYDTKSSNIIKVNNLEEGITKLLLLKSKETKCKIANPIKCSI